MTRRTRRRRHDVGLVRGLLLLAMLVLVVGALDMAEHLGLLVLLLVLAAGGFGLGRRYERRRGQAAAVSPRARSAAASRKRPPAATTAPLAAIPARPDPADQIATLERVCGRPIEAVIESYRLIQSRYSGGRP